MGITFNPPIGREVHVAPPGLSRGTTVVAFTAWINSSDFLNLEDGTKVQVWSDLPGPGRASGVWGEITLLQEADKASDLELVSDEPTNVNITALHAQVVVPLSLQTRFSYTYRLVYPSGTIKWLGEYGQNGVLVLDSGRQTPVSLADGWAVQSNGSYLWEGAGSNGGEVQVAKLNEGMDAMICAFGKDSMPTFCSVGNFVSGKQLVFIIPKVKEDAVLLCPTTVISASKGSSISLDALNVKFSGAGAFLLDTLDPSGGVQSIADILAFSSLPLRLLDTASSKFAILASPMGLSPVVVSAIPLLASSPISNVSIPLGLLRNLSSSPCLSIFSSETSTSRFFIDPINDPDTLTISLPSRATQFTVAPAHTLSAASGSYQYHISLMTPFFTPASTELPTPPPSPPLYPRPFQVQDPDRFLRRDKTRRPLIFLISRLAALVFTLLRTLWITFFKVLSIFRRPTKRELVSPRSAKGRMLQSVTGNANRAERKAETVRIDVPGGLQKVSVLTCARGDASYHDLMIEFDGNRTRPTAQDVVSGNEGCMAWLREFEIKGLRGTVQLSLREG